MQIARVKFADQDDSEPLAVVVPILSHFEALLLQMNGECHVCAQPLG
jgi:hypothetical protein